MYNLWIFSIKNHSACYIPILRQQFAAFTSQQYPLFMESRTLPYRIRVCAKCYRAPEREHNQIHYDQYILSRQQPIAPGISHDTESAKLLFLTFDDESAFSFSIYYLFRRSTIKKITINERRNNAIAWYVCANAPS